MTGGTGFEISGKGGKERRIPLHPEAFERLDAWIEISGIGEGVSRSLVQTGEDGEGQWQKWLYQSPHDTKGDQFLVKRLRSTAEPGSGGGCPLAPGNGVDHR